MTLFERELEEPEPTIAWILSSDLIPPSSSIPGLTASKRVKRKWSLIDGTRGQQVGSSLALGLGRSSSPSNNKGSSATACTTMPSAKENEEESSINPELDFTLRLGNEQTPSPKKYADSSLKALELQTGIDLELSLSTGPAESDITSVHASSTLLRNAIDMPLRVARVVHLDEGSTSYPWKPGTSSSFPLIKPWKLDYILT